MRINNNIAAIQSWRNNQQNLSNSQKSLEKLSSGLRINRAGDDAAGLSISEKMRGQIRGLEQAERNIQDGISLIQTAEGGMVELHSLLQRGRELSVQAANETNTVEDREQIQKEIAQIKEETDRIANTTEFNTMKLLNVASGDQNQTDLINLLKNSWLGQAEQLISNYFGLQADNYTMNLVLEEGTAGGTLAYVQASVPASGLGTNLELHIEMADYRAGNITDRTIAHEMVHAVFNRSVNVGNATGIPTWFNEGSAELIQGADERLAIELAALGGNNAVNRATIVGNATNAWGGTSQEYAGAFAAVRYIHDQIKAAGGSGIKDIYSYLSGNPTRTLDDALTNASSGAFADLTDFQSKWSADGEAFIAGMDLGNADTGAIGGADADGGAVRTNTSVVPDNAAAVQHFNMVYPTVAENDPLNLHIGSNSSQTMKLGLTKVDSNSLGISTADVVQDAQSAIGQFDTAITVVSSERSRLGAIQNRLEHALSISMSNRENLTSSESRIRDLDMAKEMMNMTKTNILMQASAAMLAQANQNPQGILQMLR
ncbi:flagellinolysin [Brevibacillus centrosporus]|uniref:Flagellin n=1 Tax=Brevibacillus centrosporus TaxID=54910 RepID=A0A1I4CI72_9BACL|nr:flagellinolysin [Brevibacillus centrosporus]SFK79987.1 flagellin [Brevibacillus centrosporus]